MKIRLATDAFPTDGWSRCGSYFAVATPAQQWFTHDKNKATCGNCLRVPDTPPRKDWEDKMTSIHYLAEHKLPNGTHERLTEVLDSIDEAVLTNATVHLEQLDDRVYMLIMYNERFHWHLKIHVANTQRGKIRGFAY